MTHPFTNPDYPFRPGDRFVQKCEGTTDPRPVLVEIGTRTWDRGARYGDGYTTSASDIQILYLGYCDEDGRLIEAFDEPMDYRVASGFVSQASFIRLPRVAPPMQQQPQRQKIAA